MIQGIVTKTGNSYALHVPKRFIDDNNLKLGDKVDIEEPLAKQRHALRALVNQGKRRGAVRSIPDPVAWQRKQRLSDNPWEQVRRDSTRQ